MALGDDFVGLQQIAAVITAEAELCALISSEVNGAWNNELQQLTAVTMAAGIAQAYQLVRALQLEAIRLEQEAALVS